MNFEIEINRGWESGIYISEKIDHALNKMMVELYRREFGVKVFLVTRTSQ